MLGGFTHPPHRPQEELDQEKIRELVISMRQQIYAQNEAEVSKRWNFEDGVSRVGVPPAPRWGGGEGESG